MNQPKSEYEIDALAVIDKLERKLGAAYTAIAMLELRVEELLSQVTPVTKDELI